MSSDDVARSGALPAKGPIEGVVVRGGELPRDPKALEALIAERRTHLAAAVDELVVRAHPREIARRSAIDARSRAQEFAFTPAGELRVEKLAAVAGASLAFLVTLLLVRRRFRGHGG